MVHTDDLVLFQGDSITDAGRSRENDVDLGRGYAALVAAWFGAAWPEKRARFVNRGISGNRAKDLAARWQPDCLALKPNLVSILIGINDTWRRYDRNDPTSAEAFEVSYRAILTQVRDQLGARLVICEPFLLPVPDDRR
ncbi:MAG: GDSL family lipase, partial [Anaerolineae bacterium]|nr:GDSL family lipase [Anaerolineae bacterium]